VAANQQPGQPTTAQLLSKENSSFSALQPNTSSKNPNLTDLSLDDKTEVKDSISNNNFHASFDKLKPNLSVIASNPLSNNPANSAFNDSLHDSNAMYPNDTNE